MDIYVYVCYWRDLSLLKYCLTGAIPFAKEVIVHDGRFAEFPDRGINSDDGVEKWCDRFDSIRYVAADDVYETQMDKRNEMFKLVPIDNWVLSLDADEALLRPDLLSKTEFSEDKRFGNVKEYMQIRLKDPMREPQFHEMDHGRLMFNDGTFTYGRNHFELMRQGKRYMPDFYSGWVFMHHRDQRDVNRITMKMDYYRKRKETHVRIWLVKEDTIEKVIGNEFERNK